MIRCFRYITRKAKEFAEQEMKDNDKSRSQAVMAVMCRMICAISGPKNTLWIWTQRKIRKRRKIRSEALFRKAGPEIQKKADKKSRLP